MIEQVESKEHFEELKNKNKDFFIAVFYTETSEKSKKALEILERFKEENKDIALCSVNASLVKDIHPLYGINTVPTVLVFKGGKVSKVIYGVQSKQYYEMLLYEVPLKETEGEKKRKFNRVVVYTSTSCPWCNTVKAHLMKYRIPFREVDISRDERAAQELVRRSGQMAVPQTDIDGRIVVGFDKARLNSLLGIQEK